MASDLNILFLQPAKQVADLGVDLGRLGDAASHGVVSLASLRRSLPGVGAVVNCIDTSAAARRVLASAALAGVPRLYLFDGIYDVANAYRNPAHGRIDQMDPLLYTHAACVDRWTLEAFAALGMRTHAWLPARAAPDGDDKPAQTQTAAFLIATARTPAFDQRERERLQDLIARVIAGLERIGADYRCRIGDRRLLASLGLSLDSNDTREPFSKCIRRYRCLITTPSTIATTAMLTGTPTATLDYRDSPLTQQTGWRIHGSTDIDGTLAAMLQPAAERMTFQAREVAHLANRTPVEDFILDAAGVGLGSGPPPGGSPSRRRFSLEFPLRWAYVNWLKRFRKGL